jgi:hypothetical protein
MAAIPTRPGLYWAKRRFVERDNGLDVMPVDEWEIVCVYENSVDGTDRFNVLMIGVEEAQPLQNFQWGFGPLTPPAE